MKSLFVFLAIFISSTNTTYASGIDGSSIKNLNQQQRNQFARFLTNKKCTCSCNLIVARCLRTHKSCNLSTKMAQNALQIILASNTRYTPPIKHSRRSTYAGNLDRRLIGVWYRRTTSSNRYVSIHSRTKLAFSPNGIVTLGSRAAVFAGRFRNKGGISNIGRWSTRGNMIYMNWKNGLKEKLKYVVFAHDGSRAINLGGTFYKWYSR